MHVRVERSLAVIGAAALLIVGIDGITYAATGSSLILGNTNYAGRATTLVNTGTGAAMNLQVHFRAYPPFTTNATGLVAHLFAARAANADRLNGLSAHQIESAASMLSFVRTDVAPQQVFTTTGTITAVQSGRGAQRTNYTLTGTVTFGCDLAYPGDGGRAYQVQALVVDSVSHIGTSAVFIDLNPTACGSPVAIPATSIALTPTSTLAVQVRMPTTTPPGYWYPTTLSVNLYATPTVGM